jgi:hypothetical protein
MWNHCGKYECRIRIRRKLVFFWRWYYYYFTCAWRFGRF